MLTAMDLAAASAGPWLVLGVVVGLVLAGVLALAVGLLVGRGGRRRSHGAGSAGAAGRAWVEDDLPGFLEQPPGVAPDARPSEPAARPPRTRRWRSRPRAGGCPAHAHAGRPRRSPAGCCWCWRPSRCCWSGSRRGSGVVIRRSGPTAADAGASADRRRGTSPT